VDNRKFTIRFIGGSMDGKTETSEFCGRGREVIAEKRGRLYRESYGYDSCDMKTLTLIASFRSERPY
jgi:hypothetical protein